MPVHNGRETFLDCSRAILAALGPNDEFIVVADGETDGVWRTLESERVTLVVNEETQGPAAARNRGADIATGDILFFVDSDVVIQSDTLARVRTAFSDDSSLDALMGSYDDAPGHSSFYSQYRNLLHHHTHQSACVDASTFWAGCGAIRRPVFAEVGGFDEDYRYPCVEDIELGYRLRKAGRQIRLDKDLQVKHLKAWTPRSIAKTDLFRRAVPWTLLLLQKRTFENDLNINIEGRLSVMATWALPLAAVLAIWAPGPGLAVASGLIALILMLNGPFYRFLYAKRGPAFALRAMPWHLFYFAYSGLGFAIGVAQFLSRTPKARSHRIQDQKVSPSSACSIPQLSSSAPGRQA